jgi:hypothetical protein
MKKLIAVSAVAVLVLFCGIANAAPPPTWRVGELVAVFNDSTTTHLIQFPGSPVDCTDDFSTDWCLSVTCGSLASTSTYGCQTAPITNVCLAWQVSGGSVIIITGVDSDACK